jgi:hypothetical protein
VIFAFSIHGLPKMIEAISFFGSQFKEMGASSISRSRVTADAAAEQQSERKKNFLDWRNLMKPMNEEKDHWVIILYL